jgi:wobble nucleotide-excising tRNase
MNSATKSQTEQAAKAARDNVKRIEKRLAELQAQLLSAKAEADKLNKQVVKSWGLGN